MLHAADESRTPVDHRESFRQVQKAVVVEERLGFGASGEVGGSVILPCLPRE
jgi:hypothetical protein